MEWADIVRCIDSAFPALAFGEGYIDEKLDCFPFDYDGINRRWDWYDALSKNVLEFLEQTFSMLGKSGHLIVLDLQMSPIREKVERIEGEYELYRSIMARGYQIAAQLY